MFQGNEVYSQMEMNSFLLFWTRYLNKFLQMANTLAEIRMSL